MKEIIVTGVDVEETREMHLDPDLYNRRYAIESVSSDYTNGTGKVSFKEIAAMEKQPEYEFVKVSLEQVVEDIMGKGIDSYYFIAPDGKEYKVVTLSIEQLKLHKNSLYRRVELTPEQKREREVEELARKMFASDTLDNDSENWAELTDHIHNSYLSMAKAAIEWMESKK